MDGSRRALSTSRVSALTAVSWAGRRPVCQPATPSALRPEPAESSSSVAAEERGPMITSGESFATTSSHSMPGTWSRQTSVSRTNSRSTRAGRGRDCDSNFLSTSPVCRDSARFLQYWPDSAHAARNVTGLPKPIAAQCPRCHAYGANVGFCFIKPLQASVRSPVFSLGLSRLLLSQSQPAAMTVSTGLASAD